MAVLTQPTAEDFVAIARAHALPETLEWRGVAAGSVNSNFELRTPNSRFFLRVYEEQDVGGAEWEWRLLETLVARGVPVPRRVVPVAQVGISGKPTAVFEWSAGYECCQQMVTEARLRILGEHLATAHLNLADYPDPRSSRFTLSALRSRFDFIRKHGKPEHLSVIGRLESLVAELGAWPKPTEVPAGILHGDLFRDNVRWANDDEIDVILDWESAGEGAYVFDLAVTSLAWCFGDKLDWNLVAALFDGYESVRPLETAEISALRDAFRAAATRFTITRITDYALRENALGDRVTKDWRRFLARLDAVERETNEGIVARFRLAKRAPQGSKTL
jgi:homoserine kinase type II